MAPFELATFDLSPYQSAPLLSATATVTLALDLDRAKPDPAPAQVTRACKRMVTGALAARDVLLAQLGEGEAVREGHVEIDRSAGRLWSAVQSRLEYWMVYDDPSMAALPEVDQQAIDLDHKRDLAGLARRLDARLFGADGLRFLVRPFADQVVEMHNRLQVILTGEDHDAYVELIGEDLIGALQVIQARYAAMVHDRATQQARSSELGQRRIDLQRTISLYASAVLSMLDEDEPSSVRVVEAALRPIVNARRSRRAGASSVTVSTDGDPELELAPEGAQEPELELEGSAEQA